MLLLIAFLRCAASGESLSGRWDGALVLGGARQPMVLDIEGAGDRYRVRIHVPSLLRVDTTARFEAKGDSVVLTLPEGPEGLVLRGVRIHDTLSLDNTVNGVSGSGAPRIALRATRVGDVPQLPYREDDIVVPARDRRIGATVVFPVGPGPHPGIVLIHGSGRSTREPLLPLARHFASHGVAAVAYDKREPVMYAGDELTPPADLAADAIAVLKAFAAHADVSADHIGVWGGSQGSGIAAHVATTNSRVRFVVSVSGGGTDYTTFVVYQTRNRLRSAGRGAADLDAAESAIRARHAFLQGNIGEAELGARLAAVREQLSGTTVPLSVPSVAERGAWRDARTFGNDAATVWRSVRVPVLALWGERDALVPVRASAVNIPTALPPATRAASVVCIAAGADHGMALVAGPQAGPGGGFAFPRLAPAYLDGMVQWVRHQAGLDRSGSGVAELRGQCEANGMR